MFPCCGFDPGLFASLVDTDPPAPEDTGQNLVIGSALVSAALWAALLYLVM
jgi:hypothetical protein